MKSFLLFAVTFFSALNFAWGWYEYYQCDSNEDLEPAAYILIGSGRLGMATYFASSDEIDGDVWVKSVGFSVNNQTQTWTFNMEEDLLLTFRKSYKKGDVQYLDLDQNYRPVLAFTCTDVDPRTIPDAVMQSLGVSRSRKGPIPISRDNNSTDTALASTSKAPLSEIYVQSNATGAGKLLMENNDDGRGVGLIDGNTLVQLGNVLSDHSTVLKIAALSTLAILGTELIQLIKSARYGALAVVIPPSVLESAFGRKSYTVPKHDLYTESDLKNLAREFAGMSDEEAHQYALKNVDPELLAYYEVVGRYVIQAQWQSENCANNQCL